MPPPNDASALRDIAHAAQLIFEVTHDLDFDNFVASWRDAAAVERELTVIGEAVKRLTTEFRTALPETDWKGWAGLRDVIVHAYDSIDYQSIWKTVRTVCPRCMTSSRNNYEPWMGKSAAPPARPWFNTRSRLHRGSPWISSSPKNTV
jgi:uncharacterized protein with HEPN domain